MWILWRAWVSAKLGHMSCTSSSRALLTCDDGVCIYLLVIVRELLKRAIACLSLLRPSIRSNKAPPPCPHTNTRTSSDSNESHAVTDSALLCLVCRTRCQCQRVRWFQDCIRGGVHGQPQSGCCQGISRRAQEARRICGRVSQTWASSTRHSVATRVRDQSTLDRFPRGRHAPGPARVCWLEGVMQSAMKQ